MKDFLNSNEGINITNNIVRYRNWVQPLNSRKKAILDLKGKVDNVSMDSKILMQKYIVKRLSNPVFIEVKLKFQKNINTIIAKLREEEPSLRENFIEVIDYNFLEPSENVYPILNKIIKNIYSIRRRKEVA